MVQYWTSARFLRISFDFLRYMRLIRKHIKKKHQVKMGESLWTSRVSMLAKFSRVLACRGIIKGSKNRGGRHALRYFPRIFHQKDISKFYMHSENQYFKNIEVGNIHEFARLDCHQADASFLKQYNTQISIRQEKCHPIGSS